MCAVEAIHVTGGITVALSAQVRETVGVLLVLTLMCLPAMAAPVPRSINELSDLAMKHSAELSAYEKEQVAKEALAVQAGTISNPTLELQGATGSMSGSPEEHSFAIGINQEFPLNGTLRLRHEAGQHEAEAARQQRNDAARLLRQEIITLAMDFQLATKRRELALEFVKLNRDLVTIAEERFKAGDIPELDLNLAKVELIRADSSLLQSESELAPLRIKISTLTGLAEHDIVLADTAVHKPIQPLDELTKQAFATRPDMRALSHEQEKSDTEVRLAEAEALPSLTAGVFAQWQRGTTEVGGMSSVNSDTQLGIKLSMPIPLFDRNQGGKAAAVARQGASSSRKLALQRTISAEVAGAVSRLTSSEKILAMYEQGILPQLAENLKLSREAYQIGEIGLLSVIDEQKKYFEVHDNYLAAQHSRRMALLTLETVVGMEFSGGVK